jgi:hypothetical protein
MTIPIKITMKTFTPRHSRYLSFVSSFLKCCLLEVIYNTSSILHLVRLLESAYKSS